jgi:hypothetical protein
MRDTGWTYEKGAKHIKPFAPDGVTLTILPSTPSDRRALASEMARFRGWCRKNHVPPEI